MEQFLPHTLSIWITQYGSFALFVLLAIGIFAMPLPDETLLVFAGALIAHGKLSPVPTYIAAILGAMAGISVSYTIGRTAGAFVVHRYGRYVGITEPRIKRVHAWFDRFGRWALLIGYFVPGVRHLTGYAAGVTEMSYKHFALFAYTGGAIWASFFLSIGYFVGGKWEKIEAVLIERWDNILLVAIVAGLVAVCLVWVYKKRKRENHYGK